ncbi:MAG: pantetheine-phosphate adenylyltransferase [Bernardetiaceae bacterium]
MGRIAIFPGSFDPFTKGHEDVILKAVHLFDQIVIGIGQNPNKQRYFPLPDMLDYIRETFAAHPNVQVETYQTLTIDFARQHQARFILRGLRNTTDFDYENPIAQINRIQGGVESVFFITSPEYAFISSSIVREMHRYGRDVSALLPYALKV